MSEEKPNTYEQMQELKSMIESIKKVCEQLSYDEPEILHEIGPSLAIIMSMEQLALSDAEEHEEGCNYDPIYNYGTSILIAADLVKENHPTVYKDFIKRRNGGEIKVVNRRGKK